MPDRWPPTIGMIGFDQGTKNAIALTVLPPELRSTAEEVTPPPACPDTVTVTFSGLLFICCLQPGGFGTPYYNFVDSTFLDIPYTSSMLTSCAGLDCFWPFTSPGITVTEETWNSDSTCSSTPDTTAVRNVGFAVGKLGSTWYVFATVTDSSSPNIPLLFLGSGTNPAAISNFIICSTGNTDDTPLIECVYGMPLNSDYFSIGGTASVV